MNSTSLPITWCSYRQWMDSKNYNWWHLSSVTMMMSSNGNNFRVNDHLCKEFTGPRWIPHTKASDTELWCFFICVWINGWVNNGEAGDLRRYRAHYDVTVMPSNKCNTFTNYTIRTITTEHYLLASWCVMFLYWWIWKNMFNSFLII